MISRFPSFWFGSGRVDSTYEEDIGSPKRRSMQRRQMLDKTGSCCGCKSPFCRCLSAGGGRILP